MHGMPAARSTGTRAGKGSKVSNVPTAVACWRLLSSIPNELIDAHPVTAMQPPYGLLWLNQLPTFGREPGPGRRLTDDSLPGAAFPARWLAWSLPPNGRLPFQYNKPTTQSQRTLQPIPTDIPSFLLFHTCHTCTAYQTTLAARRSPSTMFRRASVLVFLAAAASLAVRWSGCLGARKPAVWQRTS